ncbi:Ribosomal protein S18 acetylase RimI [Parasphingorhabdus marina DSM 22363]|uniref:Ribosomal protein S18 acetylase RimI n=1 Tax=Parasphingorhabdus marina DSM 22363 TaxID=1123272 RepID=A0A1N6CM88_9SPHN|nr:GNAT family acetyltransferase [Parasphingorhabdus marina]SIN59569.1 Ribosomal protein S18 acetylase RimI [Parasphingorhabdus marina DSM 22363]
MTGRAESVRSATPDDREAVIALWQACDLTRPWNDAAADFQLAIEGETSVILILQRDRQIVATIMTGFDGHRGWVYYLAVDPGHRRAGYGRKMMGAAEQWLRDRKALKIQLMVREDNAQAIGFYQAIGYETQPVVTIGRRLDSI